MASTGLQASSERGRHLHFLCRQLGAARLAGIITGMALNKQTDNINHAIDWKKVG